MSKKNYVISLLIVILLGIIILYQYQKVAIKKVVLSSPNNNACQEQIHVELDKPASIFIKYWKVDDTQKFHTIKTAKKTSHDVQLLLLEVASTYEYQIVIENLYSFQSKIYSFNTREQSQWLDFNWVQESKPHDAEAFGDGLVMICYSRKPGYIAMVDAKGSIKWYWQVDDIGVRAATITPRGTILAMLRPPKKDEIDDKPKEHQKILQEIQKPMRRGKMGFAGATALVEIDATGKTLWRLDLDQKKDYQSIHHDAQMDENNNIHTLYRANFPFDMAKINGTGLDTLGGDGILVIDSLGNEIWKWSVWDIWDIEKDSLISDFAYDRFHMNALNFDTDGNYLVSVAIEDQIWKINSKTGELMWKLGKGGDFEMDSSSYFSFQHAIHVNQEGDYMLFDNNLFRKESRALSFELDTVAMTATTKINAPLPTSRYTSRMGNAYTLDNGNILQTSSKTGTVLITDRKGSVLWELNSHYVPYRTEYVTSSLWDKYFIKEK